MRVLNVGGIPTSLGEIINFKYHLDLIKREYDQIVLSFQRSLLKEGLYVDNPDWAEREKLWEKYLIDLGQLFFSEPPYVLEQVSEKFCGDMNGLIDKINIRPQKAELGHLLCKGTSLNIGEYIVITTKIRDINRTTFDAMAPNFWSVLQKLANKYKIVILGERKVETRKEYNVEHKRSGRPIPFGIYEDIIQYIPKDKLEDRTVAALGETVSDLTQIQQDCLIMKEAKFVITIGIGGNFCLATASANMVIGYRADNISFADGIFNYKEYPNAIVTKSSNRFLNALNQYTK